MELEGRRVPRNRPAPRASRPFFPFFLPFFSLFFSLMLYIATKEDVLDANQGSCVRVRSVSGKQVFWARRRAFSPLFLPSFPSSPPPGALVTAGEGDVRVGFGGVPFLPFQPYWTPWRKVNNHHRIR